MVISNKTYTITEFDKYEAANPNLLLELIDGSIVEKVVGQQQGKIVLKIGARLVTWVEQNNIKGHYGTEVHHQLEDDDKNKVMPYISFEYSDDDVDSGTDIGMPAFAVEFKSPNNTYDELRDKAKFYIANGTHLVWLVYPTRSIVEVYFADGSSELFNTEHTLSGGDVLPKFEVSVQDIFK